MPEINTGDFFEVANQAIKEGRHVAYIKDVFKQFDEYKKYMLSLFTVNNSPEDVYQFRVNYLLKRPVWRDIVIRGNQTLEDFAEGILDAMCWENGHLHCFSFFNPERKIYDYTYSIDISAEDCEDMNDPFPKFKTCDVLICNIDFSKAKKMHFTFDFGDDHEFEVEFKCMRKAKKGETLRTLPHTVDQRGIAPSSDRFSWK